jgi:hypothetical protein
LKAKLGMQPPTEFLTPQESAEVDKALLTSREKFSARVAIYALRALKQIAEQTGVAIAALKTQQIVEWVNQDESLQSGIDQEFRRFFAQLVNSSRRPLQQAAADAGVAIEALTVPQVVAWFEREARQRLQQPQDRNG